MSTLLQTQATELGKLLSNTIGSVVSAQEKLDEYTLARKQAYEEAEIGSLALPPLWYVFKQVAIELELSASVQNISAPGMPLDDTPHIVCRTLDPTMVSLYGHAASSGMKVRVIVEPGTVLPIRNDDEVRIAK